ncbi:MAG: AMP-binding protein [Alphaproteobacteria bacterium]|nr:AMP-binding protein [Alphaproteobacteria bacterium]
MTNFARTGEILAVAAMSWPDNTALIDRNMSISYLELFLRAQSYAQSLSEIGLASGARVAVVTSKSIDTVAYIFGCFLHGAVVVPINPKLKRQQVEHILINSDTKILVLGNDNKSFYTNISLPGLAFALLAPHSDPAYIEAEITAISTKECIENSADVQELAMLFYTSGSTGMPKAVMCRHSNLIAGAESVAAYLGNTTTERILAILPLSFDAGFSQLTTGFIAGATVVLSDYLLPSDISKACAKYNITGITGVPAIWEAALRATWTDQAREELRYFANTGGHFPKTHLDQLRKLFPSARPFPMYGLTEAFRSTYLDPTLVDRKLDSIGQAIPGARVVVVDGTGEECAVGEVGELVHAGPTVAAGYWKDPEATSKCFRPAPNCLKREGFFDPVVFSGDLVKRDAEGFLYFVSRVDRQIKILGNRVSLTEVENTALKHEGIIACAVGAETQPDNLDPILHLFYVSSSYCDIEDSLSAWCRTELPSFMLPRAFVRRNDLLLNSNNKYDVDHMIAQFRRGEKWTK